MTTSTTPMGTAEPAAARLDRALVTATAVDQGTVDAGSTVASAYAVQADVVCRRLERGERLVGVKMGFTSRAKAAQMGVSDVIVGRLTDAMAIPDGGADGTAAGQRFIHPRVEPEVAFLLGRRLAGPVTALEAVAAVVAVAPALEVIDSRLAGFRFSLPTVIADNASAAGFVIGAWAEAVAGAGDLRGLDNAGMVMAIDGSPVGFGSTAAILGHPVRSLVAAARLAAATGAALEPGAVVLAGAATAAVPLPPGAHVELEVEGLGRAAFRSPSPASEVLDD